MELSKHLQNTASATKRAATTLRKIANTIQSIEDKGVLLAAARIAESVGNKTADDAKAKRREEEAYRAFMKKAKVEAEKKIRADWPMETTLQKVAIWSCNTYYSKPIDEYMRDSLYGRNTYQSLLTRELDEAISEIADSIAYHSYHRKISVTEAICERARKIDSKYLDRTVIEMAKRVDVLLASETLQEVAA